MNTRMAAPYPTHYRDDENLPNSLYVSGKQVVVHWIEDNAQLKQCANAWHTLIALDTEFMRTDTFFPKPGLYQVAFQGEFYLIDPLAIDDWHHNR